jgi:hypothetical protein
MHHPRGFETAIAIDSNTVDIYIDVCGWWVEKWGGGRVVVSVMIVSGWINLWMM